MTRTAVITDWRTKDENLPDLAPGEDYERVIVPQMFCVLHRIIVRGPGLNLVSLRIDAVADVPFELESVDGEIRNYRLKLDPDTLSNLKKCAPAAAAIGSHALALMPALAIRLVLRNEGDAPTKPRAALIVQEEERP